LTLADAPGAIAPVPKLPLRAVESCVVVSLFVHVTVVPTDTLTGFGAYAVVDNTLAPLTIDTLAVEPVGAGVGAGAGVGVVGVVGVVGAGAGVEPPPQAVKHSTARRIAPRRTDM
jgi:hypothetical protein